jgi:hypothetical protein
MNSEENFKGFGDALVNFLYSLAKSKATGVWTGEKVSNYVLSQALIASKLEAPGGLDKHEKGDYVEAYIAKAWIDGTVTINEAASILIKSLIQYDLEEKEREAVVEAFQTLLNHIKKKEFTVI